MDLLTPPITVHAIHRAEARGVPRIAAVVRALSEVTRAETAATRPRDALHAEGKA